MNREEIFKHAREYARLIKAGSPIIQSRENSFISGATWMQEQLIEKACKWLDNELMRNQSYDSFANVEMTEFVDDFKQAMKGK